MSDTITLTIYGDPKAQKRHRHAKIKSKKGLDFITNYDPSKSEKQNFLLTVQNQRPKEPFDVPLSVDMAFYFSRPKGHYGTGKNANVLKPSAPKWHTSKPDVDNLRKFYMDSLNKIYWKDDSVICAGQTLKQYSNRPRVEIVIRPIKDISVLSIFEEQT